MAIRINKQIVLIFLLVILAIWVVYPFIRKPESFNADGTEFVCEGCRRHGLRGDPLKQSSILKYYIRPDPHVMLNNAGGEMWISDNSPVEQGIQGCQRAPCPTGYDNLDQCWQCSDAAQPRMESPEIWPH
jgi:hypothetical protein